MKKPTEFLCKECLPKLREYDAQRRKKWRNLNIKQGRKIKFKVKIKKHESK